MAENAELVVSKHSVWTPEKKDFTFMGHTVEGDLANLMQFANLVANAEREACAKVCEEVGDKDDTFYREESRSSDCAFAIRARGQA